MPKKVERPWTFIRVKTDLLKRFQKKCKSEGKKMAAVVAELIEEYMGRGQ